MGFARGPAAAILVALGLAFACAPANALDKVTFGANWLADPEAGGFYQAVVDGTYEKYGLDVTIMQGGPQTNGGLFLVMGKIEFYMGGDLVGSFVTADQNLPTVIVAAEFQKDPRAILSHPGVGLDQWSDLPKASTAFISGSSLNSFYAWMRAVWGFSNDNVKPYNFNSAPFIVDKHSIQQAYATSEPFAVERLGGFKPNVFLVYDHGFTSYGTTIMTRRDLVEKRPDLVQRFVDASAIGWRHYLHDDNSKANALIKKDNPDMTDEQIAYSIAKLKEYGLVESGDAQRLGIGAMTDERMKGFFDQLVKAKMVKPDLDYKTIYTLQFVDKGVGLDEPRQ